MKRMIFRVWIVAAVAQAAGVASAANPVGKDREEAELDSIEL